MTHPVDIHAGKKLKELRVLRGKTQTDIANGLNISFQQIQKYELGRNRISASKLYEIANILNVPPAYFFEGLDQVSEDTPVMEPETVRAAALFEQVQGDQGKEAVRNIMAAIIDAEQNPIPQKIAAE